MIFTNQKFSKTVTFFHVATISLVALLTGCQNLPTGDVSSSQRNVAESGAAFEVSAAENPYLANPVAVPARAKKLFDTANAYMAKQQWLNAEKSLLQLTQQFPELSGGFVNLGLVYKSMNQPEKAKSAFQQAITANPNNLSAYNELAIFLREKGEFDKARGYYEQALSVWPNHAQSHLNLGILYELYLGEFSLALRHYEAFQKLTAKEDKQVAGWIIDLRRRTKNNVAASGKG